MDAQTNIQTLENQLKAKLTVIELTRVSSEDSITNNNVKDCERKLGSMEAKFTEIHQLKDKIQEAKVIAGEEENGSSAV